MFTEIYIEALLFDDDLADQVWEAWHDGKLNDGATQIAWLMIAGLFWADDQHGDNSET